jgi:hypothetical protein
MVTLAVVVVGIAVVVAGIAVGVAVELGAVSTDTCWMALDATTLSPPHPLVLLVTLPLPLLSREGCCVAIFTVLLILMRPLTRSEHRTCGHCAGILHRVAYKIGFQTPLEPAERSVDSGRNLSNLPTFSEPPKFYFERHY